MKSSSDDSDFGMDRREAIKAMAMLPFAFKFDWSPSQLERASVAMKEPSAATAPYSPRFFTAAEWITVCMLADYVIPRDERSGSATDARVPEYMDWLMADKESSETTRTAMRGGLGWLDLACHERFGKTFAKSADRDRRLVLDDIAWPARAKPIHSHGVAFFNRFRDLTASGFFSSEIGYKDVRFVGNLFIPNWNGCPPEANAKLGVTPDVMKTRVPVQRA